jgi:hypothetical protein
VGQCLKFDGSLYNYATLPALDFSNLPGFSVAFWFRYAGDETAVNTTVLDFQSADEAHRISFGKWGATTHASIKITGNDDSILIPNGFSCCDWEHYTVVVTRLPQANVVVFRNGQIIASICKVSPGQNFAAATCGNVISYNYPNAAFTSNYLARSSEMRPYFTGRIDSLGIFPWSLTDAQVSELYIENTPKKMPFPFKAPCPVFASSIIEQSVCACEPGTYNTAQASNIEGSCESVSTRISMASLFRAWLFQ